MKQQARITAWSLAALLAGVVVMLSLVSAAHAGPAAAQPPANLRTQPLLPAAAQAKLFAQLRGIGNLHATFAEAKKITLLIKPLLSSGEIFFDRERGLARQTLAPSPQKVVLTSKTLSIWDGTSVRHTSLAQARDVAAIASAFPMLLRGDGPGLATMFRLELRGDTAGWWMLTLTPQRASLAKMLRNIAIVGHGSALYALEVYEANGDHARTVFDHVVINGAISDAAAQAWFSLPASRPL
ncbi:MAG: outer membrane lipoprotein carrier protein LolA [Myxococcales bacterium]|nr:outer membrane lipoprotein carrier protein LolA [Myxococcales bacterium]